MICKECGIDKKEAYYPKSPIMLREGICTHCRTDAKESRRKERNRINNLNKKNPTYHDLQLVKNKEKFKSYLSGFEAPEVVKCNNSDLVMISRSVTIDTIDKELDILGMTPRVFEDVKTIENHYEREDRNGFCVTVNKELGCFNFFKGKDNLGVFIHLPMQFSDLLFLVKNGRLQEKNEIN